MKRYLLIGAGFCSLGLGILGIFLPVLPTTPFMLLAASCFLKSSSRLYSWLISNGTFGRYIEQYLRYRAVTLRSKIVSIAMLWSVIGSTILFFTDSLIVRSVLLVVAFGVTAHLLMLKRLTREMLEQKDRPADPRDGAIP